MGPALLHRERICTKSDVGRTDVRGCYYRKRIGMNTAGSV